jgi:hypothetical protein
MLRDSIVRDSDLDDYTAKAKAIAFDTCHKIYVLMDDQQVELMREYGYGDENDPDCLITSDQMTPSEMSDRVAQWYEGSCGLRFIQAVSTHPTDPNEGFVDIVAQGEGWSKYDEDEDEDED